jgi:hypothetical protein
MSKNALMIVCLFFVAGSGGHAVAQRGAGGGRQSPMGKLMSDLQQATPRATLSEEQNNKLQADIATLKDAQQARRQGQSVDQDKVQSAFSDIRGIVDSGAFQQADQKQLEQDFAAIQPPQQ